MRLDLAMIFSSLFLTWSSFCYGINFQNNQYIPADYVVRADKITANVEAKLVKRYSMRVVGRTGGMIDYVNVLGLSFQIHGPLTKDKLREILVDCVEEFLSQINSDEKLRPFLKNYPFTPKEINIAIFVVDDTGRKIYDPSITVASAYHGKIWYDTVDINDNFGYKSSTEEDYKTARKIVQTEE